MSYKLEKPYTDSQRADFIVEYNHNQGLLIEKTDNALYALEADEIMQDGAPVVNPNYESELVQERKEKFDSEFFETSLGFVRRKVSMQTGEIKDFLTDLLTPLSVAFGTGQQIAVILYKKPDFTQDVTDWTQYQVKGLDWTNKDQTQTFLNECFAQLNKDFFGA